MSKTFNFNFLPLWLDVFPCTVGPSVKHAFGNMYCLGGFSSSFTFGMLDYLCLKERIKPTKKEKEMNFRKEKYKANINNT